MKNIFLCFLIYILTYFIMSCAHIVAPSGGKKDTEAPQVMGFSPAQKSLNLISGNIILSMNEYVQINDPNNSIYITPETKTKPIVTAMGKDVKIILPKDLEKNTTYTIYLGNTIKDITENNPIENLKYVFSTGPSIDSTKLEGSLTNSYNDISYLDYWVGLYNSNASNEEILNSKTSYLIKPSESGQFSFDNIKNGSYRIVAFKDENKNKKYDSYKEGIGYSNVINTSDSTQAFSLINMFYEESEKTLLIKNTNYSFTKTVLKFNKKINNLEIEILDSLESNEIFQEAAGDSITLWHDVPKSTCRFVLNYDGNKDTIDIFKNVKNKKRSTKNAFSIQSNLQSGKVTSDTLQLKFSPYIKTYNTSKLSLTEDNKPVFNFSLSPKENITSNTLQIIYPFKEDKKYVLKLLPEFSKDPIANTPNDSLNFAFQKLKNSEKGSIKIESIAVFKNPKGQILWLFNSKKQLILTQKIYANFPIELKNLNPDKYFIKIVHDSNNNGKFDKGILEIFKQSESVFNYSKSIEIKAGFENRINIATGKLMD